MTARLAIGINALHGVAGHVLHARLLGASAPCAGERHRAKLPLLAHPGAKSAPGGNVMARIVQREACGVKQKGYKVLWYGCGGEGAAD